MLDFVGAEKKSRIRTSIVLLPDEEEKAETEPEQEESVDAEAEEEKEAPSVETAEEAEEAAAEVTTTLARRAKLRPANTIKFFRPHTMRTESHPRPVPLRQASHFPHPVPATWPAC